VSRSVSSLFRSSLARGASVVLLSRIGGVIAGYGAQIALARWAGPTAYGTYSLAFAWAAIGAVVTTLGLPQALVRLVPEYTVSERWDRLRGLLRFSLRLIAVLSLGTAVLVSLGVVLVEGGVPLLASPSGAVLVAAWTLLPALAFMRLSTELCRAQRRMAVAYLPPRVARPLIVIGGVAAIAFGTAYPLSGTMLVGVVTVSLVAVAGGQLAAARRFLPLPARSVRPSDDRAAWMHLALPLALVSGMATLLLQTDLIVVGAFLDVDSVGHYRVALHLAAGVSYILSAANAVGAPRFAGLHASGDTQALQHLVRRLVTWISVPTIVAYGTLLACAPFLLDLFGPTFREAYVPLLILATGHLFSGLTGPVDALLHMTGHHTSAAWVYGSVTVCNVGLSAAGLYLFGLVGAAAATALCMIAWNVALHALVRRRLGITPSVLALVLPDDGVK
jgi:O-antigen/teichoic acid export membrane protein